MKEQRKLINWIKEHKKELIIAGISIGAIIAIALVIKNQEAIKTLWASLRKVAEKPIAHTITSPSPETAKPVEKVVTLAVEHGNPIPHTVDKHIRNLPEGWHASAEKLATALENGFELAEGQTWVADYATGVAA